MLDRPEEALPEFRRSVRLDENNRVGLATLGRLLVSLGRADEGVAVLERLQDRYDLLEPETIALARGYADLGEQDRAKALVEQTISESGETAPLLQTLGSIASSSGRREDAMAAFERTLELDPDAVHALNFVAYTLAEEERDLERALELALKAVGLAPDNPLVRDTLGWVYFRLDRLEDAEREILAAVELGARDPVVFEHLGDTLQALGRSDEAIEAWSQALTLDPGFDSSRNRIEDARRRAPGDGEEGAP
jgi:tetratricopeptide (TPR) repeat protein